MPFASSTQTRCRQTRRLARLRLDTLGHGFQTAYLTVREARATIARNVVNVESGLVPVPKTETGTDPACLPEVIEISDPANCASTLADSCVDKFFGPCFDPSGHLLNAINRQRPPRTT